MTDYRQAWEAPTRRWPIVHIGAGAIVRTAHLPAYRRLGLAAAGFFDVDRAAAEETAAIVPGAGVFETLDEACAAGAGGRAVFDLAVPGDQILPVLEGIPAGAALLIQKPMGTTLDEARAIVRTCRERRLTAAVNFQLRFSPGVLAIADMIRRGALGRVVDVEVRLQVRQPWESWSFSRHAPRLEILYHSVHYLDTIRLLLGEPAGACARGVRHPQLPEHRDTRSSIILDYGDEVRCSLTLNHTHLYGVEHRASMFKVEGTEGAAILTLGVNLDYPGGPPDALEVWRGGGWTPVPLRGSWFPEAFEGPMSNLQRVLSGDDAALVSPVDDAVRTMAVVEACYLSSAGGATPIPPV